MIDPAEFLVPSDLLLHTGSPELRILDISEFPDKEALVYAVFKLASELMSERGSAITETKLGKGGVYFE